MKIKFNSFIYKPLSCLKLICDLITHIDNFAQFYEICHRLNYVQYPRRICCTLHIKPAGNLVKTAYLTGTDNDSETSFMITLPCKSIIRGKYKPMYIHQLPNTHKMHTLAISLRWSK